MALTKTARLELINPYAKYGLKRRPTFEEIVGLVSENDKLLRPFPNREATRFRNSPQGSFFDGSDHLDVLKEQQTRILDRQMRENIMRREAQQNGGTFHLMRHQQQSSGSSTPIMSDEGYETPSSATSSIYHASQARHLEERVRQEAERQEEVRNKHREGLNKLNQTMMHGMMRRGLEGMQEYEEELPELEPIDSEEELIPVDDDLTDTQVPQRPRKHKETISYNTNMAYWKGKDVSLDDLKFQLYIRGVELTDAQKQEMDNMKQKGKGKNLTKKAYLLEVVENMIENNTWETRVEEQLLQQRIRKYFSEVKGKGQGKSFSQSVAEGAKEGVKQVAKAAAVKGGEILIKKAFGV